jgi:preprotein translocase subunit SecA
MDQLRQGIHLRGYAQKDPKQEYKREAFELFTSMLASLRYEVISLLSTVIVQDESDVNAVEEQRRSEMSASMQYQHDAMMMAPPAIDESSMTEMAAGEQSSDTYIRQEKKVGRNDACPCGSGKKYKKCHGQL